MESKATIVFAPVSVAMPGSVVDKITIRLSSTPSTHVVVETGSITVTSPTLTGTELGMEMLREFILLGHPMVKFETRSHTDVLVFVYCAVALGFPLSDIEGYCVAPSSDDKWSLRTGIECLPAIGKIIPGLFNPRYYFLKTEFPFKIVPDIYNKYKLGGYTNVMELVSSVTWLQKFSLESLFPETNARTIQRLGDLRKQRSDGFSGTLVHLTESSPSEFIRVPRHTPVDIDATTCPVLYDPLSRVPMDSPTVCSGIEATKRFDAFTYGVFDRLKMYTPLNNLIIAGNSARMCMEAVYRPKTASDVDVFVFGESPEVRKNAARALLEAFSKAYPGLVYYGVIGCVVSVYVCGINRKFQVICGWFQTPYDVINRFDLSHIQCGFVLPAKTPVMTIQCARAFTNYVSEVWNTDQLRTERVLKAVYNGYDVESVAHFTSIGVDVKSSLESEKVTKDALESFCSYYYPPGGATGKSREEIANISRQIKNDCKATDVVTSVPELFKTMKFDGEFNSVYGTKSWTEFSMDTVGIITPKYRGVTVIKTTSNANRFRSGILAVVSAVVGEDNYTIRCNIVDEKFAEHLRQIEGQLAGHVRFGQRNARFTRGFMVGSILTIEVPMRRINALANNSSGMLMDASSQVLDVDDALREGDQFYVVYGYGIEKVVDPNANQQIFPVLSVFKIVRLRVDDEDNSNEPSLNEPVPSVEDTKSTSTTISSVCYED